MAFVMGAFPIAATPLMNSLPKRFTAGLLQEQVPLMHDVDCMELEFGTIGHEQSDTFLHILGLMGWGRYLRRGSFGKKNWVLTLFCLGHCLPAYLALQRLYQCTPASQEGFWKYLLFEQALLGVISQGIWKRERAAERNELGVG